MKNYRSPIIKDVVFLSYCDSEGSENSSKSDNECHENFSKVIQPLAQFLNSYGIKTFCMRDPQTGLPVVPSGESYIQHEKKAIRKHTSIFVAYITKGYLNSDECRRECDAILDLINDSFDKPKFIVIYNSDDIEELKHDVVYHNSLYKLIGGNERIYLTAPNGLEEAKSDLLKEHAKKIRKSFDYVFNRSHLMSDMVLHSLKMIKTKHSCTTVSDYILQSNELTHKESGYELHIVTDEIDNYDLTVLSSMAIALNLQKNVRYIYYGSNKNRFSFNNLKEVVRGFIVKDEKSRRKVDRYIRYRFNRKKELTDLIDYLDKKFYSDFIDAFPTKIKILEHYKQYLFRRDIFKETENINKWLRGKSDKDYNYGQIKHFNNFLQSIVINEEQNKKYLAVVLRKLSSDFDNLVRFSDWNVGNDALEKKEIDNLEDHLYVSDEIREWIGYDEEGGSVPLEDSFVNEILQNMCYIEIGEKDEDLPNVSYSFCLFYENERFLSAWYRTAKGITTSQTGDSADYEAESDLDNDLIMYTANNADNDQFIEMFRFFLESSSTIRSKLKEINCSILKKLQNYNNSPFIGEDDD